MGTPTAVSGGMTIDQFYAFTDTRPDEEDWELIAGEPVLNAAGVTPSHAKIVTNVLAALSNREREIDATWVAAPDVGVRVSDHDIPEPDIVVFPDRADRRRSDRNIDDPIVVTEVLSPFTRDADLGWKRNGYTTLASLTHSIVIAQDEVDVTVFARENRFRGRTLHSRDDVIELTSLDASLPLSEIYRRIEF